MCLCLYMSASVLGDQKCHNPLDLELEVVVSHPMLVLGNELESSARAVGALN